MFAIVLTWIVVCGALVWLVCMGSALLGALRTEVEQQTVRKISCGTILPPAPKEEKQCRTVREQNEKLRKLVQT